MIETIYKMWLILSDSYQVTCSWFWISVLLGEPTLSHCVPVVLQILLAKSIYIKLCIKTTGGCIALIVGLIPRTSDKLLVVFPRHPGWIAFIVLVQDFMRESGVPITAARMSYDPVESLVGCVFE